MNRHAVRTGERRHPRPVLNAETGKRAARRKRRIVENFPFPGLNDEPVAVVRQAFVIGLPRGAPERSYNLPAITPVAPDILINREHGAAAHAHGSHYPHGGRKGVGGRVPMMKNVRLGKAKREQIVIGGQLGAFQPKRLEIVENLVPVNGEVRKRTTGI